MDWTKFPVPSLAAIGKRSTETHASIPTTLLLPLSLLISFSPSLSVPLSAHSRLPPPVFCVLVPAPSPITRAVQEQGLNVSPGRRGMFSAVVLWSLSYRRPSALQGVRGRGRGLGQDRTLGNLDDTLPCKANVPPLPQISLPLFPPPCTCLYFSSFLSFLGYRRVTTHQHRSGVGVVREVYVPLRTSRIYAILASLHTCCRDWLLCVQRIVRMSCFCVSSFLQGCSSSLPQSTMAHRSLRVAYTQPQLPSHNAPVRSEEHTSELQSR